MEVIALRRLPPVAATVHDPPRLEHFGPARVTAALDREVELEVPEGRRWARLALTYQPEAGDRVLAIAAGGECYVIGVLEGRGPTVLSGPADLELRAPNGAIRITAAEGCLVAGPAVRVEAKALELSGETLAEEFETVRTRVSGMLEVRARAMCTAVAETYRLAAQRIFGRGEASVSIDAPSINLG